MRQRRVRCSVFNHLSFANRLHPDALLMQLNSLVDALTGLERILTTPIPFSYSFHLWTVTILYCLALVSTAHTCSINDGLWTCAIPSLRRYGPS